MTAAKRVELLLKKHKKEVTRKFGVKRIGVFGSCVRGDATSKSDIDILVQFSRPIRLFKFMDLEEFLEGILHRRVDLVSEKALKPHIGRHILREATYI